MDVAKVVPEWVWPAQHLKLSAALALTMLQTWIPRNAMAWHMPTWSLSNETFFYFLFDAQRQVTRDVVTSTVFTAPARQGTFRFFPGVLNGNADAAVPTVDLLGNPVMPARATGPLRSFSVFGPDPKFFPTLVEKHLINLGGVATTNYQLIVLGVAIVFMGILQFIIYGTKFGRAMRAVSFNYETASLMGIPTDRVISTTFIIGSMLAAVAGILFGLSYPKIDPLMGIMPGLKAFIAAVLGGIGNVPGAVVGGLIIGVIESFVGGSRFSNFRDAIAFVILIAILLFRPSGLFGKYQAEKV
jgi:branched-subunit amino acid ABC-type transport system permease component